jgi:thiamine pyrophosphate-dependent acetolactate synthase large subunit-like protein
MALGAAIACPSSTVINLQADGSAMYTLQVCFGEVGMQMYMISAFYPACVPCHP